MRGFLLLSVLLIGGPLGLLASVDDQLMEMVPAGAKMVASIDVSHAKESSFGQYMLGRMYKEDTNLEEFIAQTGFDPRRDLQHVIVSGSAANEADKQNDFAVLAHGTFDMYRIKAAAKAKGATIRKYHGLDIFVNKQGYERTTGLVFPLADVAVFGDLKTVQEILDNSGVASVLDPELVKLTKTVGANNDAWFASLLGSNGFAHHFLPDGQADNQAKALESVRQSWGGIRFGDSVDVMGDALTRSPQDATSLADVIRFGASFVQMQRSKDPRAAILAVSLDRMNLEVSGSRVHVSFSVPEKSLEQLAELGPEHHGRHSQH